MQYKLLKKYSLRMMCVGVGISGLYSCSSSTNIPVSSKPLSQEVESSTPTYQENKKVLMEKSNTSCSIKGNISKKGERIYHVPGCDYYAETVIDPGQGERWFCSEQEARNAGWRKARNCQ